MSPRYYLSLLLVLLCASLRAQQFDFPPDTICVPSGRGLITNLVAEDLPPGLGFVVSEVERECFFVDRKGDLYFSNNASEERCCGPQEPFFLEVFRVGSNGQPGEFLGVQAVFLTIKCPKPDCALVDLADYPPAGDPTGGDDPNGQAACIPACENSTATYLFPEDPGLTYVWTATNATAPPDYSPGLPRQVSVDWGNAGAATLTVSVFQGNTLQLTRTWCVELTPSPVADFSASSAACLGQDIYFTNTSTGAPATFDWDFGDGNTAQNVANPVHSYGAAGTYTVTLYATSSGTNPDGSQACCCQDSISYDITIDPKPGPAIYWVSTLCEGDVSKYWTDATNCGDYDWTVSANGTIMGPTNNDTIMVQWGAGPAGIITLEATGCDSMYCPFPTQVVVPIISTTGVIAGPTEVCKGESASYELPKWLTVAYNWSTGASGGTIIGPNGGHIINVTWPTTPGTYVLEVDYGSAFLNGLPNHSGDDCYGTAQLSVTVLGDFTLSAFPNPACVYDAVTVFGNSDIDPLAQYDWEVMGYPSLNASGSSFTLNPGDVPGPGVYIVTATVQNPADYCVAEHSIAVVLKEAIAPVILGPADYCVGEPVVYTIASPAPGYTYNWSIPPGVGSVMVGQGGPTVTVVFTSTTGATLTVTGTDGSAPNCVSLPATVNPTTIDFIGSPAITGPAACTNSLFGYGISVAQHPDANYFWSVSPEFRGSVVAGEDTPSATIQWNNDPGMVTITLEIELCGQVLTLTENLTLTAPEEPTIVQLGDLCPDGSAVLYIDSTLFSSWQWNTGATTGAITITQPGNYLVNTIDLNGCPSVGIYKVEEVDGPAVSLSLAGVNAICVDNVPYPANPVLTATTAGVNTIEWFCNGISQGAAATGNATFTHVWNDTIKTYAYTVVVTDPNGCTTSPDPLFVYQQACCGPPYQTQALPVNHFFTATQRSPDCDIWDLVATFPADSVDCYNFDLPLYTSILGFGGDETVANDSITIRLPGVGCYTVESEIYRWAYDYDTLQVPGPVAGVLIDSIFKVDSIKCGTAIPLTICNPLLAEFDYSENCGVVTFEDESEIALTLVTGTVTYAWDFGDGLGTSTDTNPTYAYGANGTYTVTLTITDGTCQSVFTSVVTVSDLPNSDFTFLPNPVCYGKPVTFVGTGSNVIEYFWDFGDGATFTGNGPQHTFLPPPGTDDYDVTLITTNTAGCMDTVVKTIDIYPAPQQDTILASNGFIICDGESTTLSVNLVSGLDYLWNTGATTNSITVSTAGTYSVTLTTSDGCTLVPDPVEVQVVPLPDVSWSGNPYICDQGATTLKALAGGGHTYAWTNLTTGATGTAMNFTVNYQAGPATQVILLEVTNVAYGCVADTAINVQQVTSPAPVLVITGGDCEGDGSTITVTNPEPDVVYTWNTGETGLSIFTFQAGTYTVLATNVISGCTGTDQATINPLPDICIVPTGCYEICAPYTLYAPAGNYSYEWYQDGNLVGSGNQLVVTTSATYSVVVTDNTTGCFSVSDSLILVVIDCDSTACDDIITELKPYVNPDGTDAGCCYELVFGGLPAGIHAIEISSPDADLTILPGSVNPLFGYAANASPSTIQLAADATASGPLPAGGVATSAVAFCPGDFLVDPQTVIINYLGADLAVVCSDTLETTCPVEPDCVYVTSDTLACNADGGLTLTLELCVPSDLDYSIGYVELLAASFAATGSLPQGIPVVPAMLPGECRTFTVTLASLPEGAEFCYTLVAHSADPNIHPDALCCSDLEPRCLEVPDCDPCDEVRVRDVRRVGRDCCYDIVLFDGESDFDFDGIDLCVLGGSGTLSVFTSLGDPLTAVTNAGGSSVSVTATGGGALPNGLIRLPRICLDDPSQPVTLVEIKWLQGDGVVCRDTIRLECDPPCGYLKVDTIVCKEEFYVWAGNIVNTSAFPMGEAHITFPAAQGLSAWDTTIVLTGGLAPGGSFPINLFIGAPAGPLDSICFTVTLHQLGEDDEQHLNCCQFKVCIQLPDCQIEKCSCDNDEELASLVNQGFGINFTGPAPLSYTFEPVADFTGCDSFTWEVRRLNPTGPWITVGSNVNQAYTFPSAGSYRVRMTVVRTDENGKVCTGNFIRGINVLPVGTGGDTTTDIGVFPNPASGEVFVITGTLDRNSPVTLQLYDVNAKLVRNYPLLADEATENNPVRLDLRGLPSGVYILRGSNATGPWTRRFVVQ
ncbi:PKD domain-containing protein [Neolewinella lacunae]|uniref:PKD domain-containing protein n=1 Tax=Neolewinella lacunae TaxID=1517758 RepID=A0A923PLB9_9BACT|nr:PKD domain-containing protein [Neolewinella lacunae]MBC6992602.1 PKD domain-containing protein [Neolewinella lacunae]MDN3634343.1 PKD domain-containing protein [Neolewinella lacunae]